MKTKYFLLILIFLSQVSPAFATKNAVPKKRQPVVKKAEKVKKTRQKLKFNISARILLASKNKSKHSAAHLNSSEKELTAYLDYKNYTLLKSESKSVVVNKQFKIRFATGGSVKIIPLSNHSGKIKAKVVWNVPGQRTWSTTLNFRLGKRSIISGPKKKDGGMYIMSLEFN